MRRERIRQTKWNSYGQTIISLQTDLMYTFELHLHTDKETGEKTYRVVRHGRVDAGTKDLVLVEEKTPEAALAELESVIFRNNSLLTYTKNEGLETQVAAEEEMARLIRILII